VNKTETSNKREDLPVLRQNSAQAPARRHGGF